MNYPSLSTNAVSSLSLADHPEHYSVAPMGLFATFRKISKEQTGKSHPSNLAAPLTLRPWWRGSSVALRRRL